MRLLAFSFLASLLVAACSEDPSPDPSPALEPATSVSARATIGGETLAIEGGVVRAGRGYVGGVVDAPALHLVFSTKVADLCAATNEDRYRRDETYVAFHSVGAAVGRHAVSDVDLFRPRSDCPPSGRLDKNRSYATATSATRATVEITRLDAQRIEGEVTAEFEDLSTFQGTFSLVPCAGSSGFGDDPICD
ncbi:MAG: hypothetical protein KIT84_07435 [Labilithrix sp.]|nr:hypothetical protein [Labilithrix sp.]MCW5810827.1 hypothetical protein [Labilithrix sp.]